MNTGGQLAPNEALGSNSTASYTQVTDDVSVPVSGEVGVFVAILGPEAVGYVNELSLKTQASLSTENFYDIVLKVKQADLTSDDRIFRFVDEDGVVLFAIDGTGTVVVP